MGRPGKTLASISAHMIGALCISGMMILFAALIFLSGKQIDYLTAAFFLLIVLAALRFSRRYLIWFTALASLLTFIILYNSTRFAGLTQWLVDTLVYFVLGMIVNREIEMIRRIQHHETEMSTLSDISASLTKTLDLKDLTNQVVNQIFSLFDADGCTVYLMEEEEKSLRVVSARESREEPEILAQILNSRPRVGFGMVGWVAATGESLLSGDAEHDPRALHIAGTPFDDESVIGVPLQIEGEPFGVIWIYKFALNAFNNEDLQLAQIFANQVSVALANARLYEHVRCLSETDSLTGLLNSRSLSYITERAIEHAQTTEGNVSLFFIDCDNFKAVNDTFGHPVGDKFLRFFANVLLEGVREGDSVVRYAGDEFVILLPNTHMKAATRIAERLLETTRQRHMDNNPALQTSISVGLATYPEHAETAEELIKRADEALYMSKRNGKNQFTVFSSAPEGLIN